MLKIYGLYGFGVVGSDDKMTMFLSWFGQVGDTEACDKGIDGLVQRADYLFLSPAIHLVWGRTAWGTH